MIGLPWEMPLALFVDCPSSASALGRSCVPLRPCFRDFVYSNVVAFSYRIVRSISRSPISNDFEMPIIMFSGFFFCFTSFAII